MPSAPLSATNISRQLYGVCGIFGVQGGTETISFRVGLIPNSPFIILPPTIALLLRSFKPTLYNLETESVVISVSSVRSSHYCSTSEAILILSNLVLLQLDISSIMLLQNHSSTKVIQHRTTKCTGVLISPYPDQEGNKFGSTSETRAISTTSRRELSSSFFFPTRQDAEGHSRHSDRNIRLCHSWSG